MPRPALLAGLALLAAPVAGDGLVAGPRWGGACVPGATTEVVLRLESPVGGPAEIEIDAADFRLTRRVRLEAGRPLDLSLPVRPDPGGVLHLAARLPDGRRPEQRLQLTPYRELIEATGADGLPGTSAGYGPVGRLTLSAAGLGDLDPARTAALAAYLAGCGALVVPGATPATLAALRGAAGCGGAGIASIASALPRGPVTDIPLPDLQPRDPVATIAALLAPYPLLVLALVGVRRPRPWLLAVPVAATLLVALVLPRLATRLEVATIGQMQAGDPVYRWQARLRADGGGVPVPHLALPGSGLPRALDGGGLDLHQSADGAISLALPQTLLQRRDLALTGTAASPWQVEVMPQGPGVRIHNPGPRATPAGWLLVGEVARPVPAVAAGETFNSGDPGDPVEPTPATSPPPGLSGLAGERPRLALPLTAADLPGDGWLLIDAGPADAP